MPEDVNLRVHIAPVGFEIDRIVLPAKRLRADKVILLVHENASEEKATKFYQEISKKLVKLNIEIKLVYHDRAALFQIIKTVKMLIKEEAGNIVFINLASGSKVQAVGCMMASMMFNDCKNVKPFYVEAKEYSGFSGKPISSGIKKIEYIPTYEIQKPEERHIEALGIVVRCGGRISKKEMARKAVEMKLITVNAENQSQAMFASLDKNIISHLEDRWGFIKVSKVGRTRWIEITEEGKHAAEFLI